MSPFCLIDVAGIRDHAALPYEVQKSTWRARLIGWMTQLRHMLHG